MVSQSNGKAKQRKSPNKTSHGSKVKSPKLASSSPQPIVLTIRSSAKSNPTTPEEFGSVWFRNHNPNAKPETKSTEPTVIDSSGGNPRSSPPAVTSNSRQMMPYDLACVPPWAKYRLPPTTPLTHSQVANLADDMLPTRPISSTMNGNAIPFDITGLSPQRPQTQLYPYTMEGLSTEMFDYSLSMQLTETEQAAREILKSKIEGVVSALWPTEEMSRAPSSVPSPFTSSVSSVHCLSRPATPLPMNLDGADASDLKPQKLSASVILFGSYALGLATPSSDLDLSVVFSGGSSQARDSFPMGDSLAPDFGAEDRFVSKIPSFEVLRLRELAEALRAFDETIEVRVLEECRVPVAHVVDLPTGVSADISINMPHMETVVGMQKAWLEAEEMNEGHEGGKVRALILLTKAALRQWGVSCSFTGGLSSTGVYLLVERYLREGRVAGCVSTPLPSLGRLAIDFWQYMSSDMFQHGFLASDVFHVSNSKPLSAGSPSYVPSSLNSPREDIRSIVADEYVSSVGVSPTAPDAPQPFPSVASPLGNLSRTPSNLAPDVTRRCTRMGEIQFLFRHSATTLEQLVAAGPKNAWNLPLTPLSSVLADPRLTVPKRPNSRQLYPSKACPREEGSTATSRSDRSSTPGASSNGSDSAVSPSVTSNVSPVKFKSSLKNFVGAPCFVPRKLLSVPPPSYESIEN